MERTITKTFACAYIKKDMSIYQSSSKQLYANCETVVNVESCEADKQADGNNMNILDNHPTNKISDNELVRIYYLSIR
jgi:hypothetical protein